MIFYLSLLNHGYILKINNYGMIKIMDCENYDLWKLQFLDSQG